MRRQLLTAAAATLVLGLITGIIYPLAVWAIGQVTFNDRANGSFIKDAKGQVIGSALIGQNFTGKDGNPDPRYFQPRPSASGANGYDPAGASCSPTNPSCGASGASNLGPGDPRLVGFIPGFNTVDLAGNPSPTNPFATKDDPYCVPTDKSASPVTSPSAGQEYAKNNDGSYVCYSSTVPQRALAYRQLNDLAEVDQVPVDAVTASFSGLDPDISVANATLQAPRVAKARNLSESQVLAMVRSHTDNRLLGVIGEKTVNVLDLNLALDRLAR
jgi:potassium-transporting ATPase KdpC subunit